MPLGLCVFSTKYYPLSVRLCHRVFSLNKIRCGKIVVFSRYRSKKNLPPPPTAPPPPAPLYISFVGSEECCYITRKEQWMAAGLGVKLIITQTL